MRSWDASSAAPASRPISRECRAQQPPRDSLECRATFVPAPKAPTALRAASAGYSFGQSFVYLLHPRVNLLLETYGGNFQYVDGGKTGWTKIRQVSPGVRWAYNFKNRLQIVPGVAAPIGFGPSAGAKAIFLYLSFEHPFIDLTEK